MAKTKEELELLAETLKGQYKPLYTIEIPTDNEDEFRTVFLKKFDRTTLAVVQKMVTSGNDYLKAVEVFVKNTYVGGDDLTEIMNDLDMLRSFESVVADLMHVKQGKIKKN